MKISLPLEQNYWSVAHHLTKPLQGDHACEVLIVGGGMAGLHAAQAFLKRGFKVILIEKNFCGSGASGKSSGFITPDSEYSFHEFIENYGPDKGRKFWDFVTNGVNIIRNTIGEYNLMCDMQVQDTCVVANSQRAYRKDLVQEHETRTMFGLGSQLYGADEIKHVVNSAHYYGAVRYGGSFGINGFEFCQELKQKLMRAGLNVYEDTPAINISSHTVTTPYGTIKADHIVLCVDRFLPDLDAGHVASTVYQVQTFLTMSDPLSDRQVDVLFPSGPLMVWDTDLIYTYYRLTGDNRLMVGGGSLWNTYASRESWGNRGMQRQLSNYIAKKFPSLKPTIAYSWVGLIGVSKDIIPLAGAFKNRPWLYYVGAGAGLPWAAALGTYSAEHIVDGRTDFDEQLSPYRSFPLGSGIQSIIGKRLAFAISQGKTLFLG